MHLPQLETTGDRRLRLTRSTSDHPESQALMCLVLAGFSLFAATFSSDLVPRAVACSVLLIALATAWWQFRQAKDWHRIWEIDGKAGIAKLCMYEPGYEELQVEIGKPLRITKKNGYMLGSKPDYWSVLVVGTLGHIRLPVGLDSDADEIMTALASYLEIPCVGSSFASSDPGQELLVG